MSDMVVVGHRGYPERYPENSLVGVLAALEAGVGGVEVDVHLSRDGVPVVIHDNSVQRTAGGDCHLPIYQLSSAQLQGVSVHEPERFGQQFAPCELVTLETLCAACAVYAKPLFIELKSEALQAFSAEQFVAAVLRASAALPVHCKYLISFDHGIVACAKRSGACQTGWVLDTYSEAKLAQAAALGMDVLALDIKQLGSPSQLTGQAWDWFVYDVVDPLLAKRCAQSGVKYLESWNPPAVFL